MLLTRVITAAVLLLILVVAAQAGDHVLNAVLAVGYGITLAEWLKLTKLSGTPSYLLGGCFAFVGAGLALGAADLDVFGSVYLALQLAVACIWLAVTAVCYNARNIGFGVARSAATVLAFVVTTATWLAVWQFLRLGSWPLLISVFMIVWLADACAYFAGRLFGKNRMALRKLGKVWRVALLASCWQHLRPIFGCRTKWCSRVFSLTRRALRPVF